MTKKPIIGIVGIGMVGGPLARYFESEGFKRGKNLLCFDTDSQKKCADDVSASTILFICVPTPPRPDGSCDVSLVKRVVAKYASPDRLIVVKSTVEPATCERLRHLHKTPIFFNPEFLREASAWEDMLHPERQIVAYTKGGDAHARRILSLLPRASFISPAPKNAGYGIGATEAELGKYAANVFGALKVTFGNVIADFCRSLEHLLRTEGIESEVSYERVRSVFANDQRIGHAWLDINHGNYRGYGGYCFPKDVNALMATMRKMLTQLPGKSREAKLLGKGLKLFEAMRLYNEALLKSQGLTEKFVSRHDQELGKQLKVK